MNDAAIVELYWQRDPAAIDESRRRYGAYCRSIARNLLQNEEDAEECLNDTCLCAWNSMPEHRPERLGVYLGRLTRWISLSRLRKQSRECRGGGQAELALDELAECLPGGADPAAVAERRELSRTIDRLLDAMKPEERSVFLARYWLCATIADIAAQHGFSEGKVKTMLRRSRLKLQKQLTEEGYR
ncbi:MAG: RNA polymerase sigma factor [Oscillospiraceae bacterium]|nr:RNA polymerase sigma factor [Oscillospiraceae bacterium]